MPPRRAAGAGVVVACLLAGFGIAACSGAVRWDQPPERPASTPRPAPGSMQPNGPRPAAHVVRAGETLYSIAFRYGLTVQALSAWNDLDDPTLIRAGQRLRLSPSAGAPQPTPSQALTGGPVWAWPVPGPILAAFGTGPMTAAGIQLRGAAGDPVQAAGDGQVVYAGNGLPGYGELLIVKHDEQFLSAYGFNAALLVGEGARVRRGQLIARMGRAPGTAGSPGGVLHFEVRRAGEPIDPVKVLPARR